MLVVSASDVYYLDSISGKVLTSTHAFIRKGTYLYARIYSFFFVVVVVVVVVARRAGVEEAEDPWFFRPYLIVFDRESIADMNPAFFSVPRCPWRRAGGRNRRKDKDNARGN